jgi:hypothetical protein
MPVDVAVARRFVLANARVLDRHRLATVLDGAPTEPILGALRPYRNSDGGFGHALEPDVRGPESEPVSTLRAVEVILEAGAAADPMFAGAQRWIAAVAQPDGGVPFVMPDADRYPRAPWMVPSDGGSFLTFAFVAAFTGRGLGGDWLERATAWCWSRLEAGEPLSAYWTKFALAFLDRADDADRARPALERLGAGLDASGSLPVPGGTEGERLTPLALSDAPGTRSRALFTAAQIEADLDRLEAGQQDDGGWTFDWLAWSAGQAIEWRGTLTVQALATLLAHGRITPG